MTTRTISPLGRLLAVASKPTLLLCIVGILLPNLLSLAALVAGIGVPPRPAAIIAYATVALIARLAPWPLTVVLFLAVAVYDAVATLALLFNLAPTEIATALHLSADLKLFESPLYIALVAGSSVLLVITLAGLIGTRRMTQRGNPLVLVAVAFCLAGADFVANASPHYHFGTLYGAGRPIDPAVERSGFREAVLARPERHAVLVMVEALGEFADPRLQALILQPFDNRALRDRYTITTGSTTYYGSTTAAEMRELCETREPYRALLEGKSLQCLPALARERGYRTVALHNFGSRFFDRHAWYPRLGFQDTTFAETLQNLAARRCGGPFKGVCDADVIPLITNRLQSAQQPTFFYWLTLSTHVPVAPQEGTPRLGCRDKPVIPHVEVCDMTELWLDVLDGLATMASEIEPAEILIVGDHAPPLWSKAARRMFVPGQVPWIRLQPRRI
jgi:hypothetical protein